MKDLIATDLNIYRLFDIYKKTNIYKMDIKGVETNIRILL